MNIFKASNTPYFHVPYRFSQLTLYKKLTRTSVRLFTSILSFAQELDSDTVTLTLDEITRETGAGRHSLKTAISQLNKFDLALCEQMGSATYKFTTIDENRVPVNHWRTGEASERISLQ